MAKTTHGLYVGLAKIEYAVNLPKEYKCWKSMKTRVLSPSNDPKRQSYRGLSICDRWLTFENFFADMGEAPSDKHTIDRIDNAKGYSPDNCRWATHKEQQRNKTDNNLVEWQGKIKCLVEWADELRPILGLSKNALSERLRRGWTVERAFTTPNKKK